jgi:hypothetical protein
MSPVARFRRLDELTMIGSKQKALDMTPSNA